MDLVFTPSNLLYRSYEYLSIELVCRMLTAFRSGGGGGGGGSSPVSLTTEIIHGMVFILVRQTFRWNHFLTY